MSDINYLAVLVAGIASMPVGAVWFSPLLFSKAWMKEMGKKSEDMNGAGSSMYLLTLVAELVAAYVLANFINYAQANTLVQGMQIAFWSWLGFVVPAMAINYLFEGRSKKLFLITSFHHLAVLLVMGAILGAWS